MEQNHMDVSRAQWRVQRREALHLPSYTLLEEVLNAVSHGVGVLLAIAALVFLLVMSSHDVKTVLCLTLYSVTLFVLYIVSTLYHALGINKAKQVFRILDHCSIFLLIAGTYTPINLLIIGGTTGWVLFGIIWGMAVIGVVLNAVDLKRFAKISVFCYIGMGWAVVFAVKPLLAAMPMNAVLFLVIGGVAYTAGAVLYAAGKKKKYMHSLWHLFVLAGSILHFFTIFLCVKR